MPRPGVEGPQTHRFQTCLTVKEVFGQHRRACPGLTYHRVPMPDFCAPREEVRGPGRRGLFRGRGGPPASPLAWALAVGIALLRDWELVLQGFRFGGFFTSLPSLVFAHTHMHVHLLRAQVYMGR